MNADSRDPLADKWGSMSDLEKIEWMIETDGFALEVVPPDPDSAPPRAGYSYTINFPEHVRFPDVTVFGLTPVAARGLLGLVRDTLATGTEIPMAVELVGLLDNELRCCFAPVDLDEWSELFADGAGVVPGRRLRARPTRLPRPQRVPALRGGLRPAPAVRPAGDRPHWLSKLPGRRFVGRGDDVGVRESTNESVTAQNDGQWATPMGIGAGQSSHSHSTPCSSSSSRKGSALKASGPRTPAPLHAPVASISMATAGITAVCQTTAW